jgi:hypothetical protein
LALLSQCSRAEFSLGQPCRMYPLSATGTADIDVAARCSTSTCLAPMSDVMSGVRNLCALAPRLFLYQNQLVDVRSPFPPRCVFFMWCFRCPLPQQVTGPAAFFFTPHRDASRCLPRVCTAEMIFCAAPTVGLVILLTFRSLHILDTTEPILSWLVPSFLLVV